MINVKLQDEEWMKSDHSCAKVRSRRTKSGGQENQALERSRGEFSTKIHITVDGLGNPLLTTASHRHIHESSQVQAMLEGLNGQHIIAD